MSAAPRIPHPLGAAGLRMTAGEYFSIGETDDRYELIDGVLVASPSPTMPHQDLVRALLRQLEPQVEGVPGSRLVVDTDIKFDEETVYRPDLSLYLPGRLEPGALYPDISPDLLIEVISPSTLARDLVTKRDDYARFGVPEYWAVDPRACAVRVFRATRRARRYATPSLMKASVESVAVPGLRVDVAMLFEQAARMGSAGAKRRRPRG